jgi:hypothetical protein
MAATRISNIGEFLHPELALSQPDVVWCDVFAHAVMKYKDNFCLRRSPGFLTYYVFSAG